MTETLPSEGHFEELAPRWTGALAQDLDGPHLFAVVTWGAAATTWLAKALNSHPEVLCFHHCNNEFLKLEPRVRADGIEYAAIIRTAAGADYPCVGDVHGFYRWEIDPLRQAFGDAFSSVVLVREPIARIRTQLAHLNTWDNKNDPVYRQGIAEYIEPIIESAGVDLPDDDFDRTLFVHVANLLNSVVEEDGIGPFYKAEEVTSDPNVFGGLVAYVSGGRIKPELAWAESALRIPRINIHRNKIGDLSEWQEDVLRKVVSPRAWELYEAIGYERPSFVRA